MVVFPARKAQYGTYGGKLSLGKVLSLPLQGMNRYQCATCTASSNLPRAGLQTTFITGAGGKWALSLLNSIHLKRKGGRPGLLGMGIKDQSVSAEKRHYYSSSQGPFHNANNILMFFWRWRSCRNCGNHHTFFAYG